MRRLQPKPGFRESIVVLLIVVAGRSSSAAEEPLKVLGQLKPGTHYVGQGIELTVLVAAEKERPEVTAPKVDWGEVTRVGTERKPISASGIGDIVFEKNLFLTRFRVVARRAGMLTLPPFAARLGERKGSSTPLGVMVKVVPSAGRPAEFLGGVGDFEVDATAEPASVRSGQTINYRVTLRGPGAWGLTGSPDLSRVERLLIGLQVEQLPDEAIADPPSHTYVYRLRPTRAGEATLPPVAVAGFNPRLGRYVTKVTKGISVRVADVPRFDPDALVYLTADGEPEARPWRSALVVVGAVVVAAIGLGARRVFRSRNTRGRDVRGLCAGVLGPIANERDDAARGRVITEALIAYLSLSIGRAPGALTPVEAEDGVRRATGCEKLARDAHRLVAECDRAMFDGTTFKAGPSAADGLGFFEVLASASLVEKQARPSSPSRP